MLRARIRSFFQSPLYLAVILILLLLGNTFAIELFTGGAIILLVAVGCFVEEDLRYAVFPLLGLIFSVPIAHSPNVPDYSDYYVRPPVLLALIVLFLVLLGSLILFVLRNRKRWPREPLSPTALGIFVFCLAITPNGLFNSSYTPANILYALTFSLSALLIYVLFSRFIVWESNAREYVMLCFLLCGLLISLELLIAYGRTVEYDVQGRVIKESVLLGWGVWTAIGGMLLFLMPSCFYFAACKKKHGWLGYAAGMLLYVCILLSRSRGALLVGTLTLLLSLAACLAYGKRRKRVLYLGLLLLLLAFPLLWYKRETLVSFIRSVFENGLSDNGRFALWRIGLQKAIRYPLLGSGFYDSFVNPEWPKSVYPYFYHNTPIQLLGATGLLGFVGYAVHRLQTVRLILCKRTPTAIFLGIGILGLLLFSLLDVLFFNTYPMLFYALMLLCVEKSKVE